MSVLDRCKQLYFYCGELLTFIHAYQNIRFVCKNDIQISIFPKPWPLTVLDFENQTPNHCHLFLWGHITSICIPSIRVMKYAQCGDSCRDGRRSRCVSNVRQSSEWRVFYWEKAPTRIFPTQKSFLVYSATILKIAVKWMLFCLDRIIQCESAIGCFLKGQGANRLLLQVLYSSF